MLFGVGDEHLGLEEKRRPDAVLDLLNYMLCSFSVQILHPINGMRYLHGCLETAFLGGLGISAALRRPFAKPYLNNVYE